MSISSFNFENTFFNCKKWYIKSSTTKIEDENIFFLFWLSIKTISNSGGCWLINNSEYVDTWDSSSIFSSLSLGIIEIGWDCDNCISHIFSKICFSNFFHFLKNHRWNLFSLEFLCLSFILNNDHWLFFRSWFNLEWPEFDIILYWGFRELSSNKSLGIKDCIQWISCCLILSGISNESFVWGEGNIWWCCIVTLIVSNNFNLVVNPYSDAWVCSSKINTDGRWVGSFWSVSCFHLIVLLFLSVLENLF